MKRGFTNHYRLEKDNFLGAAHTVKKYNIHPAPSYRYPYGIEKEKRWELKGELYELTQTDIQTIDEFEGVPKFYYRKKIDVICEGKAHKAFIYFRANENPNLVEDDIDLNEWTLKWERAGDRLIEFYDAIKVALDESYTYKKTGHKG
jgi:gamma-glutamylcyclotransferase (GGCT)/AIG2-like uncharacterized protein YtfP